MSDQHDEQAGTSAPEPIQLTLPDMPAPPPQAPVEPVASQDMPVINPWADGIPIELLPIPEDTGPEDEPINPDDIDLGDTPSPYLARPAPLTPVAPPAEEVPVDEAGLAAWRERVRRQISTRSETTYQRNLAGMVNEAIRRWTQNPAFHASLEDIRLVDLERLVTEMLASSMSPATKVAYRSAILWGCRTPGVIAPGPATDRAITRLLAWTKKDAPLTRVRRSREQGRSIREEDLPKLLNALLSTRRTDQGWPAKTGLFIMAGLQSGARPSEWEEAHWFDYEQGILRLPNLKLKRTVPFMPVWVHIPPRLLDEAGHSLEEMAEADGDEKALEQLRVWRELVAGGRAREEIERDMYFADAQAKATDQDTIDTLVRLRAWEIQNEQLAWRDVVIAPGFLDTVNAHVESVKDYLARGGKFSTYFDGCRSAIHKASLLAFGGERLYSLYDCRSTAAANLRSVATVAEAAQTLGHYSKRTRVLRQFYAGAERAHTRGGSQAPRTASTENQRAISATIESARQADASRRRDGGSSEGSGDTAAPSAESAEGTDDVPGGESET